MRKKDEPIRVGDTFVKTGDGNRHVWAVTRLWTHIDGLAYARLEKETNANDIITVSVLALSNRNYFLAVQHAAAAAA